MGTEIKSWQIIDHKLTSIDTTMPKEGRIEHDLENWIMSNPEIIGTDVMIIGHQVETDSGPIDLLGIDRSGSTVIIELKRGLLPRNVLAQAIDYAANVAEWKDKARLDEECSKHLMKELDEAFNEVFPDVDLETITFNNKQRIILVGFAIENALERMIEWLSDQYKVNINATILSYGKTKGTEEHEILMKTSVVPESRRIVEHYDDLPIPPIDETTLKQMLSDYLSREQVTNQRIRKILLPALLEINDPGKLSKDQLNKAFINSDQKYDASKVGFYRTLISAQLSMKKNGFLRQVIAYEYPHHPWEKDNFSIRKPEYRKLIREVFEEIEKNEDKSQDLSHNV